MNRLRDASIRLYSLYTTYTTRGDRDRGEGPVSYIAVVLLIAVIATAIAATGVGNTIVGFISSAVSRVWTNGTGGSS